MYYLEEQKGIIAVSANGYNIMGYSSQKKSVVQLTTQRQLGSLLEYLEYQVV